ncbi:MAG: MarC family protein [Magnetovibrionaceae bacterium]
MLEVALVSFTTLFATIGPLDVAALYAALTVQHSPRERRVFAIKGVIIATLILFFFALVGEGVLEHLGISLSALRTAGGILLLLIAIDMVFARPSGGTTATSEEAEEAGTRADISVFPLASPLIAGPGAIGAVMLLMADARDSLVDTSIVLAMLAANLFLTLVLLLAATQVQKLLGVTGLHVVSRMVGLMLAALAVQFMFDGLAGSGLFASGAVG